jgi:3-isopropylmalate/(R)-2-methylmalate dehydratase large subunit
VAKPHSPENAEPAENLSDVKVDQVYIGSCTGGKLTDFIAAARILNGRKTAVDTFIVPATTDVAKGLLEKKIDGKPLRTIFEEAGCRIGNATCGACLGGPDDTFGRLNGEEICVSTTNRNFPGRMGSKKSQVFLASPLTAAATAVTGKITDPRKYLA